MVFLKWRYSWLSKAVQLNQMEGKAGCALAHNAGAGVPCSVAAGRCSRQRLPAIQIRACVTIHSPVLMAVCDMTDPKVACSTLWAYSDSDNDSLLSEAPRFSYMLRIFNLVLRSIYMSVAHAPCRSTTHWNCLGEANPPAAITAPIMIANRHSLFSLFCVR